MIEEKKKILIVGAGKRFQYCVSALKCREAFGEIEIVAVADKKRYADSTFGWPLLLPEEFSGEINGVLLTDESQREILNCMEIKDDLVVPWQMLFLPQFTFDKYLRLKQSHISIIAPLCWGGYTYHYFMLQFNSPFINMFFDLNEYLLMLKELKDTINRQLIFERAVYSEKTRIRYPIFSLDGTGIKLYMNHYSDFDLAKTKWEERKKRINWDNLFVAYWTYDEEKAKVFQELPYKKKVCFTPLKMNISSTMYLECKNPEKDNYQPFKDTMNRCADGSFSLYDPFALLLDGFDKYNNDCSYNRRI